MDNEPESERMSNRNPDLRRRIRLSFWLLLFLAAVTGWRVFIVRLPIEGPSWYGLTVGQSTTEDVIAALGEPSWIRVRLVTGTVYHYEGWEDESWRNPTIYFRNNQVIRIRVTGGQDTTLWTFVEQYGKPDLITDVIEVRTIPPKGFYWLDEGIYFSVIYKGEASFPITYFRPCPPRFADEFCIFAEQWNDNDWSFAPAEDTWGIMSPLPTPTLTRHIHP